MLYALQPMSESSLFSPVIVDVRSVGTEPEASAAPSSVVVNEPGISISHIKSEYREMENMTVTDVQVPSSSNTGSCLTSVCCSSPSLVSLRPLTSFAGRATAEHYVSHSSISAVGSMEFSENSLTGHCSEMREEAVEGCGLSNLDKLSHKSPQSDYCDTVSVPSKTLVAPHTNDINSKKSKCLKSANVDGSLKGKRVDTSAERQKPDRKSHKNDQSQRGNEHKLSSVEPTTQSKKRKFEQTAKTGMHGMISLYLLLLIDY